MIQETYEEYYEDGSLRNKCWYKNQKLHREDGPAIICYNKVGLISSQQWYNNGKRHREDYPAAIWYYVDGSKWSEFWHKNGQCHREDGPAEIHYKPNGTVSGVLWYKNGKHMTKISQEMLTVYMASHSLTLAELLLSNDEVVRKSVQSYKWNGVS